MVQMLDDAVVDRFRRQRKLVAANGFEIQAAQRIHGLDQLRRNRCRIVGSLDFLQLDNIFFRFVRSCQRLLRRSLQEFRVDPADMPPHLPIRIQNCNRL